MKNKILFILIASALISSCSFNNNNSNDNNSSNVSESSISDSASLSIESPSSVVSENSSESNNQTLDLSNYLNQNYDIVTFTESANLNFNYGDTENEEISYTQMELIENNKYQITFEINDELDLFYLEYLDNSVKLYTTDDYVNYQYEIIDIDIWENVDQDGYGAYQDYYSTFINPSELEITNDDFIYQNNSFVCKEESLSKVGNQLYEGYGNVIFSNIVINVNEQTITSISYDISDEVDGIAITGTILLSYEDINDTVVVFPVAEEKQFNVDYIDPAIASPINDEQSKLLDAIFNSDVDSFTCYYESSDTDDYAYMSESLRYENGKYDYYDYIAINYGDTVEEESMQMYAKFTEDGIYIIEEDDNNMIIETLVSETDFYYYYAPYAYAPNEFSLSASFFLVYDDTFVYSNEGLELLNEAWEIEGGTIKSVEVTVNDDNTLNEIKMITLYEKTADYDAYMAIDTYVYENINSTSVNLPEVGTSSVNNATNDQINVFNAALQQDFSNVTIIDTIFGSENYFVGDTVESLSVYDGEYYISTLKTENDKYYFVNQNGTLEEIPFLSNETEYGYNYYVPVFDFAAIDTSKLMYNSFENYYYIPANEVNLENFVYYLIDLVDIAEVTEYTFTINDEGYLSSVGITFILEGELYDNYGFIFMDYGSTILYSENI